MNTLKHVENPSKCFCQIPAEKIRRWLVERYVNNRETLELLNVAEETIDKEAILAVALIDVDDHSLLQMMGDVDLPDHHILHCREETKKILIEIKHQMDST